MHASHASATAIAAPSTQATPRIDTAELRSLLIGFVVEQTGYPEDIVEMDADLEADLGIDSIKKAQLFGEVGSGPGTNWLLQRGDASRADNARSDEQRRFHTALNDGPDELVLCDRFGQATGSD